MNICCCLYQVNKLGEKKMSEWFLSSSDFVRIVISSSDFVRIVLSSSDFVRIVFIEF